MNAIDRTLNCKKILKICQLRNLVKCKLNIFSGESRKFWLKEGGGGGGGEKEYTIFEKRF